MEGKQSVLDIEVSDPFHCSLHDYHHTDFFECPVINVVFVPLDLNICIEG